MGCITLTKICFKYRIHWNWPSLWSPWKSGLVLDNGQPEHKGHHEWSHYPFRLSPCALNSWVVSWVTWLNSLENDFLKEKKITILVKTKVNIDKVSPSQCLFFGLFGGDRWFLSFFEKQSCIFNQISDFNTSENNTVQSLVVSTLNSHLIDQGWNPFTSTEFFIFLSYF